MNAIIRGDRYESYRALLDGSGVEETPGHPPATYEERMEELRDFLLRGRSLLLGSLHDHPATVAFPGALLAATGLHTHNDGICFSTDGPSGFTAHKRLPGNRKSSWGLTIPGIGHWNRYSRS